MNGVIQSFLLYRVAIRIQGEQTSEEGLETQHQVITILITQATMGVIP